MPCRELVAAVSKGVLARVQTLSNMWSTYAGSVHLITGDESKRLVGMQIPEVAVEAVLDKLEHQSGYKHVRNKVGLSGLETNKAAASTATDSRQYTNTWMQGDDASAPIELD